MGLLTGMCHRTGGFRHGMPSRRQRKETRCRLRLRQDRRNAKIVLRSITLQRLITDGNSGDVSTTPGTTLSV